jgi:hypothetical protein
MNPVHILPPYFLKININTVTCMSDHRRGLDWWLDLLPSYTFTTRDYTSQIINKQRLVLSVSISRFLATDFNTGTITISFLHSIPYRSEVIAPTVLVITYHIENTPFPTVTLLLCAYSLPRERVYRSVDQKRSLLAESPLSNGSICHNIILPSMLRYFYWSLFIKFSS